MPSNEWDTPFTYGKMGNKEFPDRGSATGMPFCLYEKDMPSGSTPIDSPIDNLKFKQSIPVNEKEEQGTSTSYNKAEWDTPFSNRHELGKTHPQD